MRDRTRLIKAMPCLACELEGRLDQCGPTEEHHLNFDGKAGQKRRGDDDTIPLGTWHHQGAPKRGYTAEKMAGLYGPSLKSQSKAFRATYGSDDELLARVNRKLGLE